MQKSLARNAKMGRTVKFPLFEKKITSEECKRIIRDEWKIELPSAYKTLSHNNCIPCAKGGKAYFKLVWQNYPERFEKMAQKEEQYGYTVFKDISLKDLGKRFQNDKEWEDAQMDLSEFIPCDCWN